MKMFWVGLIYQLIKRIVGSDVIEKVRLFVVFYFSDEYAEMDGRVKQQAVEDRIWDIKEQFKKDLKSIGGWAVKIAIETVFGIENERRKKESAEANAES